jgi:type IV secretory pathway TrbL component
MSTIKRGTLVSLLFFILALIAGTGPNAAKVSKGIGGLVFIGMLLTAPSATIIGDIDTVIKSDWVGTSEHGNDVGAADQGTSSNSQGAPGSQSGVLGDAEGALKRVAQIEKDIWSNTIGKLL